MKPPQLDLNTAIDNSIDNALSTLRDAQPRPGLNARILTSLEQRAAHPQPAGLLHSTLLRVALAACAIAIASFAVFYHRAQPRQLDSPQLAVPQASTLKPAIDSPPPLEATLSIKRHAERSATARTQTTTALASCADQQPSGCPVHEVAAVAGGVETDPDAQALADLHTPSHPAPPLPLTAQEKLLLRMYRARNETLLAELNPVVRARQDDAETKAFKTFFPDPPPLQQPLGATE